MWDVKIEDEAAKVFESAELTHDDRVVIQKWAQTVQKHGPQALKLEPSVWADHELYGEWRGYRASSFSYKGRIIYRVGDKKIMVVVVKITTDHDYKK